MNERNTNDPQYQRGPVTGYAAPAAKGPKMIRRRTGILFAIGALVLGVVFGSAAGGSKNSTTAAASTTAQPGATVTVTAKGAPAGEVTKVVAAAPSTSAPAAPPKPTVVYTGSGDGNKTTASFTTGAEWSVTYTFDCANAGGTGNFILGVDTKFGGDLANALSAKGGDTSYVHDNPGSHYLSVSSECSWTLKVTNGG